MTMQFKTDTVEGTGAAINVSLGFEPQLVLLVNQEDGDRIDLFMSGMTAATGITIGAAVAAVAADGISAYAGDADNAEGFTIGSAVSESGKTLRYFAIG